MGKRGPRPTPTAILKLRGSRRADANKHEPQPAKGRPKCPKWIDDDAKRCWSRLIPLLDQMGVLAKVDGNALVQYCQLWSRWKRAEQFIQQNGDTYIIKDKNGQPKCAAQWPQIGIAHRLAIALTKIAAEFGMTPSGRSRISVALDEKPAGIQVRDRRA